MRQYLDIVEYVLIKGKEKSDRTGTGTLSVPGAIFEHEMSEGFPLLTTKKMADKTIRVELEGFIKGITDKKWYQERGCHIWDEWCNPEIVPYRHDKETKARMRAERDLGPIYGFQWRHFGAEYGRYSEDPFFDFLKLILNGFSRKGHNIDYAGRGVDQLRKIVDILKTNPDDRRMVVSSWNPPDIEKMALPPCHYSYQINVTGGKVNLMWNQRSVDTMLGLPFNIASYGLLLHLFSKASGLEEGKLIGFLGDVHIYRNHVEGAREQLERVVRPLPSVVTENFSSIFEWGHTDTRFENYNPQEKIEFQIAV